MIVVNDIDKSLEVMHNVAKWLVESGHSPSKWWLPENMNKIFMLKHSEPEEYFVAVIDGKPAASMILQETERNQSWKSVDGNRPKSAIYIHWLCVHRDFAGKGLPKILIEFAKKEAKKRGFERMRLDTNAKEEKLVELYKYLGFKLMGTEKEGNDLTAFYQKEVIG